MDVQFLLEYIDSKMNWRYVMLLVVSLGLITACNGQESHAPQFGLAPTPDSVLNSIPFEMYISRDKMFKVLPKRFDLTDSMPPVMNQGRQFSCVAFSTTYSLLSYFENPKRKERFEVNGKVDPRLLFSPSYVYNSILAARNPGGISCEAAITFPTALDFLQRNGAITLQEMPYDTLNALGCLKPNLGPKNSSTLRRILTYNRLIPSNAKYTLSEERKPFLIGMYVPESFYQDGIRAAKDKVPLIWNYASVPRKTFHAMICVGYDDSVGGGSFKIMNSWGKDWGDKGTFYLKYRDLAGIPSNEYFVAHKGIANLISSDKLLAMKLRNSNDHMVGTTGKAKKLTDSVLKVIKNDKSNKGYKAHLDVLKLGHYHDHGRFSVGLSYIDEKMGQVVVEFFKLGEEDSFQRMVLNKGEIMTFSYENKPISFGLNEILITDRVNNPQISYFLIK